MVANRNATCNGVVIAQLIILDLNNFNSEMHKILHLAAEPFLSHFVDIEEIL